MAQYLTVERNEGESTITVALPSTFRASQTARSASTHRTLTG